MKIGDITIGQTYALTPGETTRRNYNDLPRKVTVLGIEPVEVEQWSSGYGNGRTKKTARHIRVRFEDAPRNDPPTTLWRADERAHLHQKQGTEIVVEPRFIVAPYADLRRDIEARLRATQKKADAEETLKERIRACLPKKHRNDYFSVSATVTHDGKVFTDVRLSGRVLEAFLATAEVGAAAIAGLTAAEDAAPPTCTCGAKTMQLEHHEAACAARMAAKKEAV